MLKNTLAAIAIFALAGCATVGREISTAQIETLKKGETTTTQAVASLGQPTGVTKTSDGKTILSYTFAHAQARPASFIPIVGIFAGGTDVRSTAVMLTFKEDVLADYTTSTTNSGYGMGLAAGTYTQPDMTQPQEAKP